MEKFLFLKMIGGVISLLLLLLCYKLEMDDEEKEKN